MKNLYSRNEFLDFKNDELLNEGLLGEIFNKIKGYINKIKGGKEVEAIYQKYIKIINSEFKKKAQVDLQLGAEQQLKPAAPATPAAPVNASATYNGKKLFEADAAEAAAVAGAQTQEEPQSEGDVANKQTNTKLSSDTLKKKQIALQKILDLYKNKALKEMGLVLTKMGGAEKNPKLAVIIDNKKDQFKLDFLNAEIAFLNKSGDKNAANKLASERNKLDKSLQARWNLDNVQHAEIEVDGQKYKIGVPYRYKSADGIKVIKIQKKSDTPGEIIAAYISPEMGKTEPQNFKVANIEGDAEFVPKPKEKYNYYSKDAQKTIKVKVMSSADPKSGLIEVATGENDENKFKVNKINGEQSVADVFRDILEVIK